MEEHIDLFDAYENGELSDLERKAFTTRIDEDKAFKEAFDLYQDELSLIRTMSAGAEMRSIMDADVPQKKSGVLIRYLIPLGVAAAVVLALFVFGPGAQPTGPELFETYFEPFPNLVSARDNSDEVSLALNDYSAGEYKVAIQKLDNVTEKTDTVFFYKGISFLALKDPSSALNNLNQVNNQSAFYDFTKWYKGLSYVYLNKLDSARLFLRPIDSGSTNYERSQELLKLIDFEK